MDAMNIITDTARDRRALEWLQTQATDAQIADAIVRLAGQRKPYPSNIAKILGLQIPADTALTPKVVGREKFSALKAVLQKEPLTK
jgi:hypothetical protein